MTANDSASSPEDHSVGSPDALAAGTSSNGSALPPSSAAIGASSDPGDGSQPTPSSKSKPTMDAADDVTVIQPVAHDPSVLELDETDSFLRGSRASVNPNDPFLNERKDLPETRSLRISREEIGSTDFSKKRGSKTIPNLTGQVFGPYEITGELGRGGMGVVYKARHTLLRRDVALKMILRAAGLNDEVLARFRLEARSVATLKHPGIVQIYEYGEDQGVPWFSLEFVDGKTLSQLTAKAPLEPRRAAQIAADLAAAVAYAHSQGVLHRDIKPANVLMAEGDVPKLTDFGLAKQVDADEESSDHETVAGQILGTPSYMPPEQARGDTAAIGPHSDQYSLGATLYYLLAGRAPFIGSPPMDVMLQVINRDPLSVRQLRPDTPPDLETICLKALAKEPARRYPDCAALEADLRRFLRNEPILARPISQLERSVRWCRRNPKLAIPIATAIASVLLALGVSVWSAVTLASKNRDIEKQKDIALAAQRLAEDNEKLADQRAFDAKESIYEMLSAIRSGIPATEQKLRPVRKKLLQAASQQLVRLPDKSSDSKLTTGLEKARVLEDIYLTALELGEPSKAIEPLAAAEVILRARNDSQATDRTRLNLAALLYYQAQARMSAQRDMEKVRQCGTESLALLEDILTHPNPVKFDGGKDSVEKFEAIEQVLTQGYQHALTLKKLGRVQEGLEVIERAFGRFDEGLELFRKSLAEQPTDEAWAGVKQTNRAKLTDQLQLRAVLLASVGREEEAVAEQKEILENVRKLVAGLQDVGNLTKLSLALVFAGDLARQQGHLDEALAAYEESVNITRAVLNENPGFEERRNRHHVSLMRAAGLLRARDPSRARQLYAEAQRIAQEMIQADSQAITKHIALALVLPFHGPPAKAIELADEIMTRIENGTSR